jgi:hypothetical protein
MAAVKNVEDIRWKLSSPPKKGADYVIGHVHHIRALNYRKDYGTENDKKKIRDALSRYGGWDPAYPMNGEVATEKQIAQALAEREATLTFLENAATIDGDTKELYEAMLRIFRAPEAGFMDKDGNIQPPVDIGITGNRRASEYLYSMALVLLDHERTQGKIENLHLQVPVLIPINLPGHRFDDTDHQQMLRREVQIRENSTKTDGFKEPTDAEKLHSVMDLVKRGAIQNDVRKHYGAVLGLRLYFACVIALYEINKKFNLGLFTRWTAAPFLDQEGKETYEKSYTTGQGQTKETFPNKQNPNWLNFAEFNQAAFQGLDGKDTLPDLKKYPMGRMCDSDKDVESVNKARVAKNEGEFQRPNKWLMEQWLDEVTQGKTAKVTAMKEDAAKRWASRLSANAIKMVVNAIYGNDASLVDDLEKHADGLNALLALSMPAYTVMGPSLDKHSNLSPRFQLLVAKAYAQMVDQAMAADEEYLVRKAEYIKNGGKAEDFEALEDNAAIDVTATPAVAQIENANATK